jgi:hypothetical protein
MSDVSRRDFLRMLGIGALGLAARPRLALADKLLDGPFASDVVQCYDDNATSGSTINQPVVQVMMDASIMRLTGQSSVGEAWKAIFPGITTSSVVGIKVNCVNSALPTHPAVATSVANGLVQMDIGGSLFPRNNIIVWDRTNSELTACGYTLYTGSDPGTMRCFGTNQSGVGYDTGVTFNVNGVTTYPSKIMSQSCDYLINAAVIKTHSQGVVTLTLKSHYGSVQNPGYLQHSSGCSPAVPSLNQQIRDVITPSNIQKLFLIDALFGLYSGGPGGSPNFNPKLLIMSLDQVACDYQGQNVINAERARHSLSPLNAAQITTAAQAPYNLGTTDINLIEINTTTGVSEAGAVRPGEGILAVAPQPLRDRAEITLALPQAGNVELDLVDAGGRSAARVFQGRLPAGQSRVDGPVSGLLRSGSYFLRLKYAGGSRVRKVVVAGR